MTAETQQSYFDRIVAGQSEYFTAMAYLAGAILAIGALFGTVNIFYGIVSARAREMAVLRAIGYGALPVAASVVFEALLLSLLGALLGAAVAWLLFGGREFMVGQNIYRLLVTPRLLQQASVGRWPWHWRGVCCRPSGPVACRSSRRCARPSSSNLSPLNTEHLHGIRNLLTCWHSSKRGPIRVTWKPRCPTA